MNIVSGVLAREFISPSSNINILWTNPENSFTEFVSSLGHNLIVFDQLYFGRNRPQLIICNNKISNYQEVQMLSLQFHLPVIVVDHKPKSHLIDNDKLGVLDNFYCSYSIAINQEVYESWGSKHDRVLDFDITNIESKKVWNNIIHQIAKRMFKI
jgi:hypothetical protein